MALAIFALGKPALPCLVTLSFQSRTQTAFLTPWSLIILTQDDSLVSKKNITIQPFPRVSATPYFPADFTHKFSPPPASPPFPQGHFPTLALWMPGRVRWEQKPSMSFHVFSQNTFSGNLLVWTMVAISALPSQLLQMPVLKQQFALRLFCCCLVLSVPFWDWGLVAD